VTAQARTDGESQYIFLMNFNECAVNIHLDSPYKDLLTQKRVAGDIQLGGYKVLVLT